MPDVKQYKVVLTGETLQGFAPDEVKKRLAGLLKADDKEVEQLLASAPLAIKGNLDYPAASRYKEALRGAGAFSKIEPMEKHAADPALPPKIPTGPTLEPEYVSAGGPGLNGAVSGAAIRPGRVWYAVAVLLIVVPLIYAGIKVPLAIYSYLASGIKLSAPGATQVTVDRPDRYVIWYTNYGESAPRRTIPGDIPIVVSETRSGRRLEVAAPGWESTQTVNGVQWRALGEIEVERAGTYTIEIGGDLSATGLVLRRSLGAKLFADFILPALLFLAGAIGGLAVALVVFIKRANAAAALPQAAMTQKEERQWAMFSHLGTFTAFVIPFGNIIVPLVIWQAKKNTSAFTVAHCKESLNFQISLMIYYMASLLLLLIIIGFVLFIGLFIFNIIIVIMAGIKASEGEYYRYPLTIRFFK